MSEIKNLIQDLPEITPTQRVLFSSMADKFYQKLPESLYMNQYQLQEELGSTHEQWNNFLKIREIDRYIQKEIAGMAEIAARKAISSLQSGGASSSDIQAAKQLLETSKLLKQKTGGVQQIVIMHLPPKEYEHGKTI